MFTHKQRIENALALKENDRTPYSMWMHFPNRDRHPRRLAELALANQKKYDLDFIKYMPFGLYTTIDMGVDLDVYPGFEKAPTLYEPVIKDVKDWDRIRPVSGVRGEYAVVLESQRILMEMMDEHVPFLQTLFSPATTLAKMCSPAALVKHMREDPARVHRVLEMVTDTTIQFARASAALGADGFFYATQLSGRKTMETAEHEEFVMKYDLEVLNAVKDLTWFNVLHMHGAAVRIDEVQHYPVQGLSWHDRDDGPSMEEVRTYSSKAFVGGLSWGENWLTKTEEQVSAEVREMCGHKGVILGPGCVIEPHTPEKFLELVHRTILECAGKGRCCK
ncbi:uroporphyrinogen decarboxylase family protein [Pyramidobacter sp. C12-8]|uniref:uroporphyrinogen decarboxylase family protein n=1 Tax=Pyramidobacter sp. C12-8 TaxID=1943580 RepID=UPI00098F10CE|nr:uroporphyrinogen decarboxylase family protein [Pyramidobacter sp. C12-8]OON89171.1 uroporphyrinogen decarboxylase [Pyramidobacter sp. C12-8]